MSCVLGIESSCDETAVAIYDADKGLLAHALYSQIKTHRIYGGVVPELASRDHVRKLIPLVKQALQQAQLPRSAIDGVAYTMGPGLIGALFVGACFARSLAWGWQVPCIGVDHLEAHLLAPMLDTPAPSYPFLALLVSGGHTQLVEVQRFGVYRLLGETLDDAVGEAFDKTAKLLGLPYPGGPHLARLAESGRADRYHFPRPMTSKPGLDFSFSGLKTYALNTWQNSEQNDSDKADIAYAFQQAICDTLVIKCRRAMAQSTIKRLVVAGGVSANVELRAALAKMTKEQGGEIFFPRFEFCTDNGAMVAYAGCQHLRAGEQQEDLSVAVSPRHHRWSSSD